MGFSFEANSFKRPPQQHFRCVLGMNETDQMHTVTPAQTHELKCSRTWRWDICQRRLQKHRASRDTHRQGEPDGCCLVGRQNLGNVTSHKNYVRICDRTN